MTVLDVTPIKWNQVQRALLTAIAAVFYGIGWVLAKSVRILRGGLFAVGFAAGWSLAAVLTGFRAGHGPA